MLLRNAKQLEGHALAADDGVIGEVKDFFFDDHRWHIRYCVVETGRWLQSRRVLISPVVVGGYDAPRKTFPVDLTMDQVRNSPAIDTNRPLSRERDAALREYYGWPDWDGAFGPNGVITPAPLPGWNGIARGPTDGDRPLRRADPYLRSVNDTIGYHIAATDGTIGHVEDFLIGSEDWRIHFLVVDTQNWWSGKKVIIAPDWIHEVSWESAGVTVDLTRAAIKASPPFEPTMPWNDDYAAQLHEHYERAHPPLTRNP